MNIAAVVCLWNDEMKQNIESIVQQNDFPLFIRLLANKQHFWYACVWMSMFTGEYYQQNPTCDLEVFFKKADKVIANMPDLFNDQVMMQAHWLLYKFGFKKFFNNIHHVVAIANMLTDFQKNDNIND